MNPAALTHAIETIRHAIPAESVRAVILFGSAARDEAVEGSDLDLLIQPATRAATSRVLRRIEAVERAERVKVSVLVSHSADLSDIDRQLLEAIYRQGRPLLGALPPLRPQDLDLEPVRLLSLDLRGLDQRVKVQLERELFGYRSRRRHPGGVYESHTLGALDRLGGRRIGRNLVIVPEGGAAQVDRLIRARGAKRVLVPAWIQRP